MPHHLHQFFTVIILMLFTACNGVPIAVPETVEPAAQVTPIPQATPTATPISEHTTEQDAPAANLEATVDTTTSGDVTYSAEKIAFESTNLSLGLPEATLSDEGVESPQVNFGGWSNSGGQFAFALLFPDETTEQWIMNIDSTGLQKIGETGLCGVRIWSPDDSQLLCYKYKDDDGNSKDELWVTQLDTNTWIQLDEPPGVKINNTDVYNSDQIAWLDNQRLLYPTYSKTGKRHLWLHNILTGQIEEVVVDKTLNDKWRSLKLAPDKKSIIGSISVESRATGLWLGEVVQADNEWKLNYIKTVISDEVVLPT